MPVMGGKALAERFRRAAPAIRRRVEQVLPRGAEMVLADMKRLAPKDTGALAAALTYLLDEPKLTVRIGLPTRALLSDFFYARFYEIGTKAKTVTYRRAGSIRAHQMRVPGRYSPFMKPALDINRNDLLQMLNAAAREGLRDAGWRA